MNRDSNAYTFLFATVMVLVVASALAFTASALKDLQNANVRKEKMQNILATIGVTTDRDQAETLYQKYITSAISLTEEGSVDTEVNAFEINLNNELKKPVSEQRFPLYEADVDGKKYFIIPLRGA
ncbi:MAG: NADH:ubiquinone reductase (Na(+)-transporting) subunit C, partial [Flavobacteriaceae bacterium]